MKILMVCLGNICRSPLADGLLRKKVEEKGLNVTVDSAGTSSYHIGSEPDTRTQENALKHGVDLSFLRARQFSKSDFQDFDRIYAMDNSNVFNILQMAQSDADKEKVKLLLDLIPEQHNKEVPDPYYGGEQGFEKVFQLVDKATDILIEELENA
ncbi:MAG: low molecular weight phosphotyrosine protein phosphatase [Crocinitomicaceae bacterium]|jgi:protein-tyrosine phosphatase|nr:low molecular weight phosphotyrosine protein phosphatase [Crocinitomicaceae bacterium]